MAPDAYARAQGPAILLDRVQIGVPLEVAMRDMDEAWRKSSEVRLADLLRMADPTRSLQLLAGHPPSPEVVRVRALASLEQGATDVAFEAADEPWRTLIHARVLLVDGRGEPAIDRLSTLIEDLAVGDELRSEALSFRARTVPERGLAAAIADLEALERLARSHRAFVTAAWVGTWRTFLGSDLREEVAQHLGRKELAELIAPLRLDVDRASLGPVPLHVHGAMVVYREVPARIPETLVPAAALLWRLGAHDAAFRTVHFGARIGHRLYGLAVSGPLLSFATVLARHAGPVAWAKLGVRLKADEDRFVG